MQVNYTSKDLKDFELDIINEFEVKKTIRAPIHLSDGNEEHLIYIFSKLVNPGDWILNTWRSHYSSLLKGVPKKQVKQQILDGQSIGLCFPEYRCLSSAIVGGILPIATGLGWAIKNRQDFLKYQSVVTRLEYLSEGESDSEAVWCFVGDMASLGPGFQENLNYVQNFGLPVNFVVENNHKSVCTETLTCWGYDRHPYSYQYQDLVKKVDDNLYYYEYTSKFPHSGGGNRIQF